MKESIRKWINTRQSSSHAEYKKTKKRIRQSLMETKVKSWSIEMESIGERKRKGYCDNNEGVLKHQQRTGIVVLHL